ncbi:kinase-like domain-containing protein [Dichotomocladium elegans]|nr:kinase-like domain-containing protein [Dichotomocladium elegans]
MLSRIKKFLRARRKGGHRRTSHPHANIPDCITRTNRTIDSMHDEENQNVYLEKLPPRVPIQDVFRLIDSEEKQKASERPTQLIEDKQAKDLPYYTALDSYEIEKKLGEGAFSNVYMARDKTNGRKVAIKVVQKREYEQSKENSHLHPSVKRRPLATERANILKEVQIMRSVDHPNIVQLVEFIESEQQYFLVLELCEGGELFHQIVKLTSFSEALARHVITQLAQAVRYLHEECGVVHRDIKPENILYEPIPYIPVCTQTRKPSRSEVIEGMFLKGVGGGGIGRVKLADFGLSKVVWDNSTYTPCGTVGYTAPEIVCDRRYSKSVDMWAMGCVLYTLLCGFPPFYDESISSLTNKVAHGCYAFLSPWWDPVSDAAKDLIMHLLCVDPSKRYTINQFLNHPWVTEKKPPRHPSSYLSALIRSPPTTAVSDSIKDFDHIDGSRNGHMDAFSPGSPFIKEIIDVTYAVQRMGEEGTWRGAVIENPNADPRYCYTQDVDDDDDDDILFAERAQEMINNNTHRHRSAEQQRLQSFSLEPTSTPALFRNREYSPEKMSFRLDISNATLLKNRRQQVAF